MIKKLKNIVFLSYGNLSEYNRAIFCILSLTAWYHKYMHTLRIVIYTDKPSYFDSYFSGLNIQYVLLTNDLLALMLNGTGFIHRRKVWVINETFKNYVGEDVIFIDSDTFFTENPIKLLENLVKGSSLMHKREHTIGDLSKMFISYNQAEFPTAFVNYIDGREFIIANSSIVFNKQDYIWNSGVLGLSADFSAFMPAAFKLTDEFFINSKWFISEQIAFSLLLQRTTKLFASDRYIFHYWGNRQKKLMDSLILKLFENQGKDSLRNSDFIKSISKVWEARLNLDMTIEQVSIGLLNRSYVYAFKNMLKIIIRSPGSIGTMLKEIKLQGRIP